MGQHRFAAAAAGWAVAAGAAASAAAAPQRIEVIGALPLAAAAMPRQWAVGAVQTADADDIARSHAADLSAFMARRLGSVHVNEIQGNPFQADLSYRGFTASPLLGTPQGLSVYADGMRLNQPFGDVVSWDLLPKSAIAQLTLMPGSNPLFGLNTLGGAIAVQTKDGSAFPGLSIEGTLGRHGRRSAGFEAGGGGALEGDWFVTGQHFADGGWRDASPTRVQQLFGKLRFARGGTRVVFTASGAESRLTGNGLQDERLLAADRASVYTRPDITRNRAGLAGIRIEHRLGGTTQLVGQLHARRIQAHSFNADVNDDALDQNVYAAGETAANTPFPSRRCIEQAQQRDEPAEKCNGLITRGRTTQRTLAATLQLETRGTLFGRRHTLVLGAAFDASRSRFRQDTELGFLNPDRSVTGVGAFGDGISGGTVDDEPYDTRVDLAGRTRTTSLFATDQLALAPALRLTLSGRLDRTTVRNRDAVRPGGGPGSLDGDHRFSRFNPSLGLVYAPHEGWSAHGGIAQSSRTPTAVELGCADPEQPCKLPNAMAGDPPLKQVVATTLEVGLRGRSGGLAWHAGVFRTDLADDLQFVASSVSGYGYFRNVGRTRRQGAELGATLGWSESLRLGAELTLLDARYRSAETLGGASNSSNDAALAGFPGVDGTIAVRPGDRIPLLPRRIAKLHADWAIDERWSLGLDLAAVGGSLARGNENGQHRPDGRTYLGSGRSAGHAVANLGLEFKPSAGIETFVQIANLFDRRYSSAAQLGAAAFDASGRFRARPFPANANGDRPLQHATFAAPGAPRSLWFGLKIVFDRPER